jgi:hypothetical protein
LIGLGLFVYLFAVYFFIVSPQREGVLQAIHMLCGGNTDFALLWYEDFNIAYSARTNIFDRTGDSRSLDWIEKAYEELKSDASVMENSLLEPNMQQLQAFAAMTTQAVADVVRHSCVDAAAATAPIYWRTMEYFFDKENASCSDLTACAAIVRRQGISFGCCVQRHADVTTPILRVRY